MSYWLSGYTEQTYAERVYAGVLGKMIGVYLGRPIEGWTHERIMERFGEVRDYVHEAQNRPLVISDDDLSGTFAFVRAIAEHGPELGAAEIGQTWLNQIVPGRSILWWGGMGNSTEETAYIHLQNGIPAPESGSIARNGKMVAEQIGAQIFIDGWAMVCPNQPELAADLARAAASVSHDGEAIDAAVALAVMESLAFNPCSLDDLLDKAEATLPPEGILKRLYQDVRRWNREIPDWKQAFAELQKHYGYHLFPGNVHVIPNHGVILLSLLYGNDDFEETLVICNTCGWDTDCNVGNVGALMGIRHGVKAIPERWREPVADQIFVCSSQGARTMTDAVRVTDELLELASILHRQPPPAAKPLYHFSYSGSVQGFKGEGLILKPSAEGLRLIVDGGGRATTATFLPPEVPNPIDVPYTRILGAGWNYTLLASPSLHPGQQIRARVKSEPALQVCFSLDYYNGSDELVTLESESWKVSGEQSLDWVIPDLGSQPIARVGLKVTGQGTLIIHELDWHGVPTLRHKPLAGTGQMWRRAWINATDRIDIKSTGLMRFMQHAGVGQMLLDSPGWTNLQFEAALSGMLPAPFGIAVHAQGLRRHYALWVSPDRVKLVRQYDNQRTILAEAPYHWTSGDVVVLSLQIQEGRLKASILGIELTAEDVEPLAAGGIAILAEANGVDVLQVRVLSQSKMKIGQDELESKNWVTA